MRSTQETKKAVGREGEMRGIRGQGQSQTAYENEGRGLKKKRGGK